MIVEGRGHRFVTLSACGYSEFIVLYSVALVGDHRHHDRFVTACIFSILLVRYSVGVLIG